MHLESMLQQSQNLMHGADRLDLEVATEEGIQTLPIQAMLLRALSAEISLKAAICRTHSITDPRALKKLIWATGSRSAHDLRALFSLLSSTEKSTIRKRFMDVLPQTQTFLLVVNINDAEPTPAWQVEIDSNTFDAQLELAKLCFEEWRYSYELPSSVMSTSFIERFAKACHDTISGEIQ